MSPYGTTLDLLFLVELVSYFLSLGVPALDIESRQSRKGRRVTSSPICRAQDSIRLESKTVRCEQPLARPKAKQPLKRQRIVRSFVHSWKRLSLSNRVQLCLSVLFVGIIFAAAWRLFVIYRRRQRWKNLMTSDVSLHIARQRISSSEDVPADE